MSTEIKSEENKTEAGKMILLQSRYIAENTGENIIGSPRRF